MLPSREQAGTPFLGKPLSLAGRASQVPARAPWELCSQVTDGGGGGGLKTTDIPSLGSGARSLKSRRQGGHTPSKGSRGDSIPWVYSSFWWWLATLGVQSLPRPCVAIFPACVP